MDVVDIKAFIPSKDYEISKSFYSEIGFESEFVSEGLTLFQNGGCLFFLQRFFNEDLANNCMLQLCVSDIDTAYNLCSQSKQKRKLLQFRVSRGVRCFTCGCQRVNCFTLRSWAANNAHYSLPLIAGVPTAARSSPVCFALMTNR